MCLLSIYFNDIVTEIPCSSVQKSLKNYIESVRFMGENRKKPPAKSPKARENQLINLAMKLAEQQLMDGSATSQVVVHFLKLATTKEQLENEKLKADLKVAEAKIKHMESQSMANELFEKALKAFSTYAGSKEETNDEDY